MLHNTPSKELEKEKEDVAVAEDESDTGDLSYLVVYNDDHNSFDWVIECFMEVLDHTFEQSEQLALIIHFKGKATVKTAPLQELRPKKDALTERGLSAVIE
ncbi:MAG: ATP-dependent Clp protease adaptor ClpS [Saprospirales bacterium]|nr:ATP-dependent Clp protease adaptor ClpS [Saprospirales bacterium]MBK8491564.1 ATP-dependent Clp protease adaptor ClpS [Saprospirales bacterium]